MSGQTALLVGLIYSVVRTLQWRAGQLSGQTGHNLQWRAGQSGHPGHSRRRPSMEGRTIVRPDTQWRAGRCPAPRPRSDSSGRAFNGGPDNCPARPNADACLILSPNSRAGPSMEGRTIVRPDDWRTINGLHRRSGPSMEGRTIVRPDTGVLSLSGSIDGIHAPSMEGRTIVRPDPRPSMEGRTIVADHLASNTPSMEGRTIVRPDRSLDLGLFTCVFAGGCERCWKPKLLRELIQLSSCKKLPRPGFECSLGLGNAT